MLDSNSNPNDCQTVISFSPNNVGINQFQSHISGNVNIAIITAIVTSITTICSIFILPFLFLMSATTHFTNHHNLLWHI